MLQPQVLYTFDLPETVGSAPTPPYHQYHHHSLSSKPVLPVATGEGNSVAITNGKTDRILHGDRRHHSSRISTREFTDWLKQQSQKHSAKDLAALTGLSVKAAENIKAGQSGANGTTLTAWCMADKDFAAAYAAYVGLILPGEAAFAGALTKAVNEYQRMKGASE